MAEYAVVGGHRRKDGAAAAASVRRHPHASRASAVANIRAHRAVLPCTYTDGTFDRRAARLQTTPPPSHRRHYRRHHGRRRTIREPRARYAPTKATRRCAATPPFLTKRTRFLHHVAAPSHACAVRTYQLPMPEGCLLALQPASVACSPLSPLSVHLQGAASAVVHTPRGRGLLSRWLCVGGQGGRGAEGRVVGGSGDAH